MVSPDFIFSGTESFKDCESRGANFDSRCIGSDMQNSPGPNMLVGMNAGQTDFRTFPKVELHRHLEGALRLSTLLELAPQVGIDLPKTRAEQEEFFLVRTPMRDLTSVLNKFWMTQAVLKSTEIISRITFE